MVWYLYLSESPCSHLEIVCRTTCSLIASSSCESPFDFLMVLMFLFNTRGNLLFPNRYHYNRRNGPLLQATRSNIPSSRSSASISPPAAQIQPSTLCLRHDCRLGLRDLLREHVGSYRFTASCGTDPTIHPLPAARVQAQPARHRGYRTCPTTFVFPRRGSAHWAPGSAWVAVVNPKGL